MVTIRRILFRLFTRTTFPIVNLFALDILLTCFSVSKQYFGLSEDLLPFIIIQTTDNKKYVKANLTPLQIADWMKDYMVKNTIACFCFVLF